MRKVVKYFRLFLCDCELLKFSPKKSYGKELNKKKRKTYEATYSHTDSHGVFSRLGRKQKCGTKCFFLASISNETCLVMFYGLQPYMTFT